MIIGTDSELKFILRSANQPTFVLTKYPQGWEEILLTLKRSVDYGGLFHEFTFDIGFYNNGGGAEFHTFEYETFGPEAKAFIEIQYRTSKNFFETLFDGKINYSKYNRESNLNQITKVNIESNDLSQIVLNRADVKVNLKSSTTLDGSSITAKTFNNYNVQLFSQSLRLTSELQEPAPITYDNIFSLQNSLLRTIFFADPFPLTKDELPLTLSNGFAEEAVDGGFDKTVVISNFHNTFFNENVEGLIFPLTVTVTWHFEGSCRDVDATGQTRGGSSSKMQLRYGATRATAAFVDLGTVRAGAWNTASTDFLLGNFDNSGSTTILLNFGDKMWLVGFWSNYLITTGPGPHNITGQWNFDTAEISFEADTPFPSSQAPMSAIFEGYSQIAESITDQTTGAFESEFYGRKNSEPVSYSENGCGSFRAITEGTQIRGLINKEINTSLNNLFFSCKAVDNVRLGIQKFNGIDKIVVEQLDFFYDNTTIVFKADGLRNLKMDVAPDRIFNEAEFGFKKWEPETVNGILEINSVREYELDITSTKNKLEQISEYIAAGYIIEELRRQRFGITEDTEWDNDMFFVSLSRSVDGGGVPDQLFEAEDDENVTATTNINNPDQRYNYLLTPERARLRWNNVLASSIFRQAGAKVNFRAGKGATDYEVEYFDIGCDGDLNGENLAANASLAWDDSDIRQNSPLWIPERYTFDHPLSYTEYKTIRDNLYKMIEFNDQGLRKFGWIENLSFNLKNKIGNFTLIRAFVNV